IAPIRDGDGRITHYVGIQTDVTEQKEREQRLAEALARQKVLSEQARAGERAKSEFLAVMSHEIRTPLNSILGFAELIAQDCGSSEECREFAAIIGSSGQALLRILDDVLEFSRIEAGRLRMVSTPFCPAEVLKDVHAAFSREAAGKGLELSLALPRETSTVLLGDAGRLRQVLVNLVGNAIKFTERGSVEFGVRLGPGGTQQEFFVRDTGPGIPADKTSLIFDPFAQADASMSRRYGGIGLGLAIARRLAELMGGRIEVRSEPGQGAEFSLHLEMPIADASPAPPPIASASPDSSFAKRHPLRILVVEDDRINLKLALTILRKLGYEPVTAGNGRAALDLCRTQPFECILMDLHMPEMDGCEAARLIRAHEQADPQARGAYIAALTANIFPASRERCLQAGMDDCLTKPIQQGVLMNCLEKAALKAAGQRGAEPPPASSK
ncbi:MAG: ATP-binding protein, partial [Terrimicrobiaceae bacterium]|nr:ATP-binding protein [Terrimicrobiaceae bacterium]